MARSPIGLTLEFNRVPAVESALRAATLQAIAARRDEAVQVIRAYEHVITGFMRASTHGTVAVMRNDVATTAIQVDAPYALAEERGTRFRPGHRRVEAGTAGYQAAYGSRMGKDVGAAIERAAR